MNASDSHRFAAQAVTHDYEGVGVLFDVSIDLDTGAVVGLVGENGSGKSTLIKVMTGALQPTRGTLSMDQRQLAFRDPADAQKEGVGVVHQDYNLVEDLTIAENVLRLNSRPPRRRLFIDRHEVERRLRQLFEPLGIDLPPEAVVRALSAAERKFVEIARAMLVLPRFLVLDEPTASLEPQAADRVLSLLERLREQGVGVLFVSHRLDEVLRISDRVVGLRDGRVVGGLDRGDATEEELANLIVGEETALGSAPRRGHGKPREHAAVPGEAPEPQAKADESGSSIVLRLLRCDGIAPGDTLELHRGEILGLTGLLDSGATDVARGLGGVAAEPAEVEVDGQRVALRHPHDASKSGIGFIPEDRKVFGIVPEQSIALNISLASLGSVSHAGVLDRVKVDDRAEDFREQLSIRVSSIHALANTLSGGNAQKVLIARWLASGVRVLVVEEPTHGVDIGAKRQVHLLLEDFVAAGGSLVVASTDVKEVVDLCHRIAIFHHGVLTETISSEELKRTRSEVGGTTDEQHLLERLISTDRKVA